MIHSMYFLSEYTYDNNGGTGGTCKTIQNLCPKTASITDFISLVANWMVGIFVLLVVLMIIISGAQMAASMGKPDVYGAAKKRLFNAAMGLVLLLSFRAILAFLGIGI